MPAFHISLIPTLLSPAITVGLLGAIESLMSAMVADRMRGARPDPRLGAVAGGAPATTRTASWAHRACVTPWRRAAAACRPPARSQEPPRTFDRARVRR